MPSPPKRVDRMRSYTHWKWHLDEVYVCTHGEMRYLWRAVDHEGEVLESFVIKQRDIIHARHHHPLWLDVVSYYNLQVFDWDRRMSKMLA